MASKLIVEVRAVDADKWEAHAAYDDFDTCLKHIKEIVKNPDRVARLVVPGSFSLEQEDKDALAKLGVQHNC